MYILYPLKKPDASKFYIILLKPLPFGFSFVCSQLRPFPHVSCLCVRVCVSHHPVFLLILIIIIVRLCFSSARLCVFDFFFFSLALSCFVSCASPCVQEDESGRHTGSPGREDLSGVAIAPNKKGQQPFMFRMVRACCTFVAYQTRFVVVVVDVVQHTVRQEHTFLTQIFAPSSEHLAFCS